jgi:hypothetical protein
MMQTRTFEVLIADSWCYVDISCVITLLRQDTVSLHSELTLLCACEYWAMRTINMMSTVNMGMSEVKIQTTMKMMLIES